MSEIELTKHQLNMAHKKRSRLNQEILRVNKRLCQIELIRTLESYQAKWQALQAQLMELTSAHDDMGIILKDHI